MALGFRAVMLVSVLFIAVLVAQAQGDADAGPDTSSTDRQLDEILEKQDGSRERFTELFRFGLENRPLVGEVHIGTFGEFFGPPHKGHTSPASLITFRHRGGLMMVAYSVYPELGLERGSRYASVEKNGAITYFIRDEDVKADLSSSPGHWPLSMESGLPRDLAPGEILFRHTPNWSTDFDPPPEGCTGWVFLGLGGTIIVPLPGDQRPENVVWVVPKREGGFDLVWGGPRRNGLLMSVDKSCAVTLGENAPYRLETRRAGTIRWILSRDGAAAMVPPGYGMGPLTDGMSDAWISEDGEIHWTIIRY